MSLTPRRPTDAQAEAANPDRSVWVMANAGSGKTGVLIDRVARLLLAGAAPERILCLTYTKAAAAEMQARLFGLLGQWAMAPDAALHAALVALEGRAVPPDRLAEARRLFARALEAPGGLKIQTIHAFCDALLRRFPLEAGVSPRFEVLDERQAAQLVADTLETMAREAEHRPRPDQPAERSAFDRAAERLNEGGIDGLVAAILARRDAFGRGGGDRLANRLGALLGADALRPDAGAATMLARLDWPRLRLFAERIGLYGGKKAQPIASAIVEAEAVAAETPRRAAETLIAAVLTKKGEARRDVLTKGLTEAEPAAPDLAAALSDWCLAAQDALRAAETARRAEDLDVFARALLTRYEAAKARRGLLDFHDMVAKTADLLGRSDMGAWVLYKLDQGLDHVLVDEAQDTSPDQWRVIEAITAEFHSGAGARRPGRTLFVVGDEKQSIYSFQGAEPRLFGEMRDRLGRRVATSAPLAEPLLDVSFRSAPGILAFVDRVFADAGGLTGSGEAPRHRAHKADAGAIVDLWALIEPEDRAEKPDAFAPIDAVPRSHPSLRLAETLAAEIARMVREERLPGTGGAPPRRVAPGDILVLVRKRDRLAKRLILELKRLDVPVAGADRMTLGTELAAQDLIALLKALALPDDALSLAAALRSPLFGVTEDDLFALAHGREDSLWGALMASGREGPAASDRADAGAAAGPDPVKRAAATLADLAGEVDYLRPYELLERALIRHDGRRRLLARLGAEAEDPIDELLAQALAYERAEPPTLPGFLAWIEAADVAVRREMERAAGAVRVMTVHGAKGLEAPIVILPDTMGTPSGPQGAQILAPAVPPEADAGICGGGDAGMGAGTGDAAGPLLWLDRAAEDCRLAEAARAAREARAREEHLRLLYVAMTRAESWLLIAGAGAPDKTEGTWYGLAEAAMAASDAIEITPADGLSAPTRRIATGPSLPSPPPGTAEDGAKAPEEAPGEHQAHAVPRPDWLSLAPPERRGRAAAPSGLLSHGEGSRPGARTAEAARLHGIAVHLVLERLASHPAEGRGALAQALLGAEMPMLSPESAARAIAEAEAVLAAPFAASVFGPEALAEVSLSLPALGPGAPPMIGRVDRLIVSETAVTVIDIKTDAAPPDTPDDVPRAYLAQLGAYAAAIQPQFPDCALRLELVWTAAPSLMEVSPVAAAEAFTAALSAAERAGEPA